MAGIDFAVYIDPDLAAVSPRRRTPECKVIHRAATRGHVNEGWLESYRTFSYTGYHDPERVCFGKLRVLNEETIAPGAGFPLFRTENMEMIYIPIEGAMQYDDTLGNSSVVRAGEVLVVGAGRGLHHSACNANRDHVLKYIQVWIYPGDAAAEPLHVKFRTDPGAVRNNFARIISPDGAGGTPSIRQQAWLHTASLDRNYELRYRLHSRRNGAYVFMIKGEGRVNGEAMRSGDGIGLWGTRCVDIRADTMARVLVIEVPMD